MKRNAHNNETGISKTIPNDTSNPAQQKHVAEFARIYKPGKIADAGGSKSNSDWKCDDDELYQATQYR